MVSMLRGKRFKLPPGPLLVPIFGNWLQVGRSKPPESHRPGPPLRRHLPPPHGQRNLVIVSSLDLALEVLHTQVVKFVSRTGNIIFDIFTSKGLDVVFTVYGDHWRKMRRIMTVPFFTNKVLQQNQSVWEAEAQAVVDDVKANPIAATKGIILCRRVQLGGLRARMILCS